MPLYVHECNKCGKRRETIMSIREHDGEEYDSCDCGGIWKSIITASGTFTANEDADWIRSVRDVVDKDDMGRASQEFLKEPTRANLKRWMKDKGVRHLEPGEGASRPQPFDEERHLDKVMEYRREKRRVKI